MFALGLVCSFALAQSFSALAATDGSALSVESTDSKPPQKIISLDYCADQYVLQFAQRSQIFALSPDSQKSFSYLRDKAQGIAQIRPLAEDLLLARPDLVVRSYGGGPNAVSFFERSGVAVLQVGYANNLAGIKRVTAEMAAGLGVPEQGRALISDIDRRLAAIASSHNSALSKQSVLYMTTGGATSGPGTLVHDMLVAAGLSNFQSEVGWRSLPLEQLAYEQPDRVALAQFNQSAANTEIWSATRHPLAQQLLRTRPITALEGAWTSCGAWFLLDAVEALAEEETLAKNDALAKKEALAQKQGLAKE